MVTDDAITVSDINLAVLKVCIPHEATLQAVKGLKKCQEQCKYNDIWLMLLQFKLLQLAS